jgi:hypothetical protein
MTTERLPRITGTIHRADGEAVQFHITDEGYAQWGLAPSQMGETADLLDALTGAAHGTDFFFHAPAPDAEPEEGEVRAQLEAAARTCVQHHHGLGIPDDCPILQLLPENVMPTPALFAAIYAITGTSEAERLSRSRGAFRPNGTTESAWARIALRRWAIRNLDTITL